MEELKSQAGRNRSREAVPAGRAKKTWRQQDISEEMAGEGQTSGGGSQTVQATDLGEEGCKMMMMMKPVAELTSM